MTAPSRIEFDDWVSRAPRRDVRRVPRFRVLRGERSLFVVDTELPATYSLELLKEASDDPEAEKRLEAALLRWAVRRIESGLGTDAFPSEPTDAFQLIQVQEDDIPELAELLAEKTCD